MANIVNRQKASSHPTKPGGIYVGIIKSITPDKRAYVYVPKLGTTIGPMRTSNVSLNSLTDVGESVLCAHINASTSEMYILGYVNQSSETIDIRDLRVELFMDVN